MCYFGFLFFSGICSYVHFLITNFCSFVYTAYKGGVCTGIFIPGFGCTRTYETLNFIRHELSLLSCLTKVLRPNKLPSSIEKKPRASQSLPWTLQIKFSTNLSHIDNKLGAFKCNFSPQDDSPDSESKRFKIQIEAKKLKFKEKEKQFLFNAEIEDYNSFALDTIKKRRFFAGLEVLGNVSGFDSKAIKTYQVSGQERRGSVGGPGVRAGRIGRQLRGL